MVKNTPDAHAYLLKRLSQESRINTDMDSLCSDCGFLVSSSLLPTIDYEATLNQTEDLIYFYHPDHLGSSSFLSDANGLPSQHIEYLPFGEIFAEERDINTNYSTPYKFNCKELDEESGLYYYGARYYSSRTNLFYGVDPMSFKYPEISPFTYCHNNPVKLIDPSGMDDGWVDGSDGIYWDPKVSSANDPDLKPGETYLGEKGKGINPITNQPQTKYNADGTKTSIVTTLPTAEVTANDPYKDSRILCGDAGAYGPASLPSIPAPDYIGISLSGNAFVGGGFGGDITVGYINGEGFFANLSLREGVGIDVSAGIGINLGYYSGATNPSSFDFSKLGSYQNFGSVLNVSTWQDISSRNGKPRIGDYWKGFSLNGSFGSKTLWGASTGTSITTYPLR